MCRQHFLSLICRQINSISVGKEGLILNTVRGILTRINTSSPVFLITCFLDTWKSASNALSLMPVFNYVSMNTRTKQLQTKESVHTSHNLILKRRTIGQRRINASSSFFELIACSSEIRPTFLLRETNFLTNARPDQNFISNILKYNTEGTKTAYGYLWPHSEWQVN